MKETRDAFQIHKSFKWLIEYVTDRGVMDPYLWWVFWSFYTTPSNLALKLLGQPCSSPCCDRSWSTYSFFSMRRNKITPDRVQDLVISQEGLHNTWEERLKMWDVGRDAFDTWRV